jgi:glutamate N-acetyltransferase / amino-acid N-acetyltransferase
MKRFPSKQGVPGFKFAGISAGIKNDSLKDLGLIFAEHSCSAAAVFTKNSVKAAPVLVCTEKTKNNSIQAVLVNSGNANACTGQQGIEDTHKTSDALASKLGLDSPLIAPFSTGVIGVKFPTQKIIKSLPKLIKNLSAGNSKDFSESILTTDTCIKTSAFKDTINQEPVKVLGIAKGSGMIMPNMATMLAFIITDVSIEKKLLKSILKEINEETFNMISVDGDMSTNDSVIVLSSNMSKTSITKKGSKAYNIFKKILRRVMKELSEMIVKDGEGATKLIKITVKNAETDSDAKNAAMQVANSCLVKTAFFGEDFNWGRIMGALGSSGASFDMNRVALFFNNIAAVKNGQGIEENLSMLKKTVKKKQIDLLIDLKNGKKSCGVTTCDLSYEYVRINADYTT